MNRLRALAKLRDAASGAGGGAGGGGEGGFGGGRLFSGVGRILVGLGLLGYGVSQSLFNVEGGHRAVIFNRIGGVSEEVRGEGTHIVVPWFQIPTVYDVRTRPRNIHSLTGSKDLQMVNITLRVLYKPDVNELVKIFKTLGTDYDERVLPSIGNEVLKSVVAQYNASELLTKRSDVSREVKNRLVARARDFHLILDDVSLTHIGFGKEYTAAVEAKQVAQQEAERAKFVVQKALQDKRSTIVRAEGEARSAALIGEAMAKNPSFLELRRIEAAKGIATTVANSSNRVFLNSDLLMLNLIESLGFADRLKKTETDAASAAQSLDAILAEVNTNMSETEAKVQERTASAEEVRAAPTTPAAAAPPSPPAETPVPPSP